MDDKLLLRDSYNPPPHPLISSHTLSQKTQRVTHSSLMKQNESRLQQELFSLSVGHSEATPRIYLDWPVDDRLFTLENYKALETLLTVYPNSVVRVILPAPNDAYSHKIGNMLSANHFIKYNRRKYDIRVVPVGRMRGRSLQAGEGYWSKWSEQCCASCNAACRRADHTQPFHLLTYIRIARLWRLGGIFADFSFFFLAPLDSSVVENGVYMNPLCIDEAHREDWHRQQSNSEWRSTECITSTLMVFNTPRSDVLACVLRRYDDPIFLRCLEEDDRFEGALCVSAAFSGCFDQEAVTNELLKGSEGVLEDFGGDGIAATGALFSSNWSIPAHKRVVWMGQAAWTGHWTPLPFPSRSLLAAITDRINLTHIPVYEDDPACQVTCSRFSEQVPVRRYNEIQHLSTGTAMERSSCAPTVIVPGFLKSASTFLFGAITSHPQILPPLKGSMLKETYCYHPNPPRKILQRTWCFPYIEPGENFLGSDGTVVYATEPSVPMTIRNDNPNVRVVFAIRHPVDRVYSNYKFSYETFKQKGSVDEAVIPGLLPGSKFSILREMVLNGTSAEDLVSYYYTQPFTEGGAVGALFMHSIVLPAILHYQHVLGSDRVMVVNAEDLSVKNMTRVREIMNRVYSFIGVCPYELPDQTTRLESKVVLESSKEMTQEGYARLNRFFSPFNDALAKYIGINVSHWSRMKPSSRLPHGNLSRLWFETD